MKILLINQTFYPDNVATSQYLTSLAKDLVARDHQVSVLTGAHGYDNAGAAYSRYEEYEGIKIHRIRYSFFGKRSRLSRFIDFASFNSTLLFYLIFFKKQDVVIGLTSPPLVAAIGNLFCWLKGGRFLYWVMDMNPDEAIAAGWLKRDSLMGRFLTRISGWTFKKSNAIIALDDFMKKKIIENYGIDEKKITVIPPWAQDVHLRPIDHTHNSFRRAHKLENKFVIMYSGNHSPCHPLETLLEAAYLLKDDPEVIFYFIGGGSRVDDVKKFKETRMLKNIAQLPYQPIDKISESLSAADLHVAIMGNDFVGIIHPCKVYNVLTVGRPFVFIGPEESHMGLLIKEGGVGYRIKHGDSNGLRGVIESVRNFSQEEKNMIFQKSITLKDFAFSQKKLCGQLIELIETGMIQFVR